MLLAVFDGWYVGFLVCYTVGIIYFFIMYMPGVGVQRTTTPSWDLFLGVCVFTCVARLRTSFTTSHLLPRLAPRQAR